MDERYNVAHNPLGTVPNAPLASAPGKELHPPILSMLAIHGGQVKRERERDRKRDIVYVDITSQWRLLRLYTK